MRKKANDNPSRVNKKKSSKIIKRLFIEIIIFLTLVISGTILLNRSLNFETEKVIKYSEKSNLDYKVYLLKNDFYEEEYLGKDMLYVASLIDKIAIDVDYTFASEDNESIDFTYSVIGKLTINNNTDTKSYFEKSYPIIENKKVSMGNATTQDIKEQITIDYPYYNQLATGFKNMYGVDVNSRLTVYMVINKKNTADSSFELDDNSILNIVIPLTERSIDIKLDYKEIDETSNIIKKRQLTVKDYLPLIIAGTLIIASLLVAVRCVRNISKLFRKKTQYEKYISKKLKEYDRLIAESETLIPFDGREVININKFSELLDIHDNLQLPIMYFEKVENERSYFYIIHQNVVYLLTVDADNLDSMK